MSLVQQHVALRALEAGGVPGEVGRDSEDELVLDETSTADTGTAPITWNTPIKMLTDRSY